MSASDPPAERGCDVNWGSHGCDLPHGHHLSPDRYCRCDCGEPDEDDDINPVGVFPYYGPATRLWGSDVLEVWGIPPAVPISISPRFEMPNTSAVPVSVLRSVITRALEGR